MTIVQLRKMANTLRQDIIAMLVSAGSGHAAGSLGMADVFTALYFRVLKHDAKKPLWTDRDRLVLSAGHIAPVRYAAMIRAGYFPRTALKTLRRLESPLQGHPSICYSPALETSSGPLGQGLSQAVGMALSARMDGAKWTAYCIMGDGELQEGQIWEAASLAGKHRLGNLVGIVDRNNIQIDGFTEDVMPLEPLRDKWEAFGWHVLDIDGHNMTMIIDACNQAKAIYEKPTVILAHTIPGKGVCYMEHDFHWHGRPPKAGDETLQALKDLRTLRGKIECE